MCVYVCDLSLYGYTISSIKPIIQVHFWKKGRTDGRTEGGKRRERKEGNKGRRKRGEEGRRTKGNTRFVNPKVMKILNLFNMTKQNKN